MKKIIFLLLMATFIFSAKAENLYEIAKIKINTTELSTKYKYYAFEFYTSSRKKLAKHFCYDVNEIVESHIRQLSDSERKRLVIIAESDKGEKAIATIYDFDKNFVKSPPLLIYQKVSGRTGDTIRIDDVVGKKGKVNLSQVDEALKLATQKKIYFQMPNLSKNEVQNIFNNLTIIFPQDQTTTRWLRNISYLKLYLLK